MPKVRESSTTNESSPELNMAKLRKLIESAKISKSFIVTYTMLVSSVDTPVNDAIVKSDIELCSGNVVSLECNLEELNSILQSHMEATTKLMHEVHERLKGSR